MKYRKDELYGTDLKIGLVLLLILLAVLLSGCDCVAGSDAISKTVCTTDKQE